MDSLLSFIPAGIGAPVALVMLLAGAAIAIWPQFQRAGEREGVRKRLRIEPIAGSTNGGRPAAAQSKPRDEDSMREKFVKTTKDFYQKTDPDNVVRIRSKLVQAGYFDPAAVGIFFAIRFICLGAGAVLTLLAGSVYSGLSDVNTWIAAILGGAVSYFLPGIALSQRIRAKLTEYRNGFPDFMDLMVVCSDAGVAMEAAIERVSRELASTHPALAQNLQLVSIELRAGRSLDDALKSLSERLGVDEVRAFATLLQQSRELGTSLSGALRVFSDEMRHKRMSIAEEKAHALPAKMSVPVTVCILPVVLLVACIPVIVRLSTGMFN